MKFKMKKLCTLYKMWWSKEWFTDSQIDKKNDKNDFVENLKKVAPNEKEYKAIMKDYENLDKEKQEEISEYLQNVKKDFKEFYWEVLKMPIVNELVNKLKELKEQGNDNYESVDVVRIHTQLALLNVMKRTENNTWAMSAWTGSNAWWDYNHDEQF